MCDSVEKKYEITAPKSSVTKSWCLELIEGLSAHFDDLKDCIIKDVKISVKAEIHSLENTLLMKINDAKYDAEEARKIASKMKRQLINCKLTLMI